jgi:ankyrin repeat protein
MSAKHPRRKDRPGVDRSGRTPLHYAVADRDAERVRALLAEGADPAATDDDGWTPLHFAAQENAAEVAGLLLDAGAPVNARDVNGNSPLHNAVFNSQGCGDLIDLLRARGADPYATNNYGISPISLARSIANFDVRQFFQDLPDAVSG